MDVVFLDFATRALVAQCINRTGVAKQTGNVVDVVLINFVVRHGCFALGPAITHRDTGIVCIGHFVIFDDDITRIPGGNAHSALMFIRHVCHEVVTDCIAGTDFVLVLRIVRDVNFGRGVLRELAEHNAAAADFIEYVAFNHVIICTRDKVKTSCSHLRERAILDFEMVRIFDAETSIRTPEEELIAAEAAIFREHVNVEHTCLQIQEAFFARTQEIGVCKGYAFKRHVTNFVLSILTENAEERIDARNDNICGRHVFACAGLVIKRTGRFVQVPFARLVDKFVSIFKVVNLLLRRIAHESRAKHRVFALKELCSFRVTRFKLCDIAVLCSRFKAQNAFGPGNHQVDFNFVQILPVGFANIAVVDEEGAAGRVHFVQAEEVMVTVIEQIRHTRANCLFAVHVHLAETGIDTFDLPDIVLFIVNRPARHRDTARNKRSFVRIGFIADVETILTAISLSKIDRRRKLVGTATENDRNIARHGAVDGAHSLLCLRNGLERGLFGTLVGIATIGSDIECSLISGCSNSCTKEECRDCDKMANFLEAHT